MKISSRGRQETETEVPSSKESEPLGSRDFLDIQRIWKEKRSLEKFQKDLENGMEGYESTICSRFPSNIDQGRKIRDIGISPKGNYLVTAEENCVVLHDLNTGEKKILPMAEGVKLVSFQSDEIIYSLGINGTLSIFDKTLNGFQLRKDSASGKEVEKFRVAKSLTFSQYGELVIGGSDCKISVYDKNWVAREILLETTGEVNCLAYFVYPNGDEELLCGCSDRRIVLFFLNQEKNMNWNKFLHLFSLSIQNFLNKFRDSKTEIEFVGHEEAVRSVAFSPCGTRILSGGNDNTVRLFSKISQQEIKIFRHHTLPVVSVGFISDGSKILTASEDRNIKVLDLELGEILFNFQTSEEVNNLAFNAESNFIAFAAGKTLGIIIPAFENQSFPKSFEAKHVKNENIRLYAFPEERTLLQQSVFKNDAGILKSILKYCDEGGDENNSDILKFFLFRLMYNRDRSGKNLWDYCFNDETRNTVRSSDIIESIVSLHILLSNSSLRNYYFLSPPMFSRVSKGGKALHKSYWIKALKDINVETQKEILDSFISESIPITVKNYSFEKVKRIILTSDEPTNNIFHISRNTHDQQASDRSVLGPELELTAYFKDSVDKAWQRHNMNFVHLYYTIVEDAVTRFFFSLLTVIVDLFVRFYLNNNINVILKCLLTPLIILIKLLVLTFMLLTTVIPMIIRFTASIIFKILIFIMKILIAPRLMIKNMLKPGSSYADLKDEQLEYQGNVKICFISPKEADNIFESLMHHPATHPIFQSDILSILIQHRWKTQIKFYFVLETLKYLFILALVSVNLLWLFPYRDYSKLGESFTGFEIASISMDSIIIFMMLLLFWQENYESVSSRSLVEYLSNMWSIVDLCIIYTGIITMSLDLYFLTNKPKDGEIKPPVYLKLLLSYFFFITWFRILDFARGFSTTSTLFRLLIRVTIEMYSFLLVLFYMVIGAALATFILQTVYSDKNPWEFFKMFYFILLGDFGDFPQLESSLDHNLYFFILLAVTIVLVIVMLNLLIAIISDAFEKVMADIKQNELYEKLHIIIEQKRKLSSKTLDDYLETMGNKSIYFLTNEGSPGANPNYVEERLRSKIVSLEKAQESSKTELLKVIEKLRYEMSESNKRIMREIENQKKTA